MSFMFCSYIHMGGGSFDMSSQSEFLRVKNTQIPSFFYKCHIYPLFNLIPHLPPNSFNFFIHSFLEEPYKSRIEYVF